MNVPRARDRDADHRRDAAVKTGRSMPQLAADALLLAEARRRLLRWQRDDAPRWRRIARYVRQTWPALLPATPPSGMALVILDSIHTLNGLKIGAGAVHLAPELAAQIREKGTRR